MSASGIPVSLASNLPVVSPPPGVVPDFANPPSQSTTMIVLNTVFLAAMLIFVAMRLYSRGRIHASGWDDYTCVMAAVASTAHSAVALNNLQLGYGRHLWDIRAATLSALHARRLSSLSIICPIVICLVKVSILLLYLRIFGANRQVHHAVYIGLCVCGLLYSTIFGINLGFVMNCTTPNVICDLYVFLVPIPHAVNLQLTAKQMIGLLFIIFAGLMTCLVAIGRLMVISFNFNSADRFWNTALAGELTTVEINLAIILSCLPSLAAFPTRSVPLSSRAPGAYTGDCNLRPGGIHDTSYLILNENTGSRGVPCNQFQRSDIIRPQPVAELG